MRSLAAFPCLLLALSIAAPSQARIVGKPTRQPVPRSDPFIGDSRLPGPGIGRDVRDIRRRIERARENGVLSGREARRLNREANRIERLAERYGRDGLSPSERAELEARALYLRGLASRPQQARPVR